MRHNRSKMGLNALKQTTSDYVSLLRHNGDIIEIKRNKKILCLIMSQFILTMRHNNKYIIINYLSGYVSLYRTYYPHK